MGFSRFATINAIGHGVRSLTRSRGYWAVAALTLAVAVGATTALFSAVRGLIWKPLPYHSDERVGVIRRYNDRSHLNTIGFSDDDVSVYMTTLKTVTPVADFTTRPVMIGLAQDETDLVTAAIVSSNYFSVLGIRALYGRTFTERDNRDLTSSLVLSYPYFVSKFHGDPSVIGSHLRVKGCVQTVTGVLPRLPEYPRPAAVYLPSGSCPLQVGADADREGHHLLIPNRMLIGRLAPGTTWQQGNAELYQVSRRLRGANPAMYPQGENWGVRIVPVRDEIAGPARTTFMLLFGATALVMLIACANVANLSLTRALRRRNEIAIRMALGAGTVRILVQTVTEALLVSLSAAGLALALASSVLHGLEALGARVSPRAYEIRIDAETLGFCLAASALSAVLACVLPAWRLALRSRISPGTRGAGNWTRGDRGLRNLLVTVQVAFVFVLAASAGLFLRSFANLLQVPLGFQQAHVSIARVSSSPLPGAAVESQFVSRVLSALQSSPVLATLAASSRYPLDGAPPVPRDLLLEGYPAEQSSSGRPSFDLVSITPGYLKTLEIPLLRGREFESSDRADSPHVAIVSLAMARHRWPGRNPVGLRISLDGATWTTIVGIAGDMHWSGIDREASEAVYVPFAQFPQAVYFAVRSVEAADTENIVRSAVRQAAPGRDVVWIRPLSSIVADCLAPSRVSSMLILIFAIVALIVLLTGITAIIALIVNDRRREIGIKLAIGAKPAQLMFSIVRQQTSYVLIGAAVGLGVVTVFASRFGTLLFKMRPIDISFVVGLVALIVLVSILACMIPVRRIASIDPVETLRSE